MGSWTCFWEGDPLDVGVWKACGIPIEWYLRHTKTTPPPFKKGRNLEQ